MKRTYTKTWMLAGIILATLISSCKKELDKSPLNAFDAEIFWTSEDNAHLALMGVYRGTIFANAAEFNPSDWWSYNGMNWLEMATDNAYPRTAESAPTNKLTNGTLTSSLAILNNTGATVIRGLPGATIFSRTSERLRWMQQGKSE